MEEIKEKRLTGKQRVFVDAYLSNGFNATQAARTAGYKGNDNSLGVVGFENLRNPKIAIEIDRRMNEHCASANEVLDTLTTHMRGSLIPAIRATGGDDLADKFEELGADKLLKECEIITTTRTTKDGETVTEVRHKFKIHDPQAAAVHIGKHHKLWVDRHELGGAGGGALKIEVEWLDEPKDEENDGHE